MPPEEKVSPSSSTQKSPMKSIKVVMMGDSCAGKSAILERFISNTFDESSQSTIGMDFYSKQYETKDRQTIKLQVWDTAGQERFRQLMPSYIREAVVAILVFDIANAKSFANLEQWVTFMKRQRGSATRLVLVGNKSDIIERKVEPADVIKFLIDHEGVPYIETSAKTGENVEELFETIANLPYEEEEEQRERGRTIRLSVSGVQTEEVRKKKGCSC